MNRRSSLPSNCIPRLNLRRGCESPESAASGRHSGDDGDHAIAEFRTVRVAPAPETEAALRCEAKMAEIIAGIEEAGDFRGPEVSTTKWKLAVVIQLVTAMSEALLKITVTAEHLPDGKNPNAAFSLHVTCGISALIDAALSEAEE